MPTEHFRFDNVQGGSVVRQIQDMSQAQVYVPPASYGSPICEVQVTGRVDQVTACVAMIQVQE